MTRLVEQIVGLLGVSAAREDPMATFETWVAVRTERLRRAAEAGQPGLRLELLHLQAELDALKLVESPGLGQSETLWLSELIALIAEVLPAAPHEDAGQCA